MPVNKPVNELERERLYGADLLNNTLFHIDAVRCVAEMAKDVLAGMDDAAKIKYLVDRLIIPLNNSVKDARLVLRIFASEYDETPAQGAGA